MEALHIAHGHLSSNHSSSLNVTSPCPTKVIYNPPFRWMKKTRMFTTIVTRSMKSPDIVEATHFVNTKPSKDVLTIWKNASAVCFDVDGIMCLDEEVDELAAYCGAGKVLTEWYTRERHGGSGSSGDTFSSRLLLFRPSFSQIQDFLNKRPSKDMPDGIVELVQTLKSKSTDLYLISDGFRQLINPVALNLGIPLENVYARQIFFGDSGEFLGLENDESTPKSGGKANALQHVRKVQGNKILVTIGDGAIHFEVRRPGGADLFICYGRTRSQESIAAKADWLVFQFQELIKYLK